MTRELLSPPWLAEPLYQCATAVTVWGFVAHAVVAVELDGTVVLNIQVSFPEPVGATLTLPAPLVAGQQARVRQISGGLTSPWSRPVVIRAHTADFPAGPPQDLDANRSLYRIPDAAMWARTLCIEALNRACVAVTTPALGLDHHADLPGSYRRASRSHRFSRRHHRRPSN